MGKRLLRWLGRVFSGRLALRAGASVVVMEAVSSETRTGAEMTPSFATELVPYDEHLLDRSRTQWQFGDWESLAQLNCDTLQHHPDRAKLALLVAAGHQQLGDQVAARQFSRLAQDWGCSRKLVAQVLIAGVHNTLAKAAAVAGQMPRALNHFQASISIDSPNTDLALATQARVARQWQMVNLPTSAPINPGKLDETLG